MKQNKNCRDGFSLRENIARAESVQEVKELLEVGKQFVEVSRRTRQAWQNTSQRRIVALLEINEIA